MSEVVPQQAEVSAPAVRLELIIQGQFRDSVAHLTVREGRFTIFVDGNNHDLNTELFSRLSPKKLLIIGGSVAAICFGLSRLGFKADNFRPFNSVAFTVVVGEDESKAVMENIKSGQFQQAVHEETMSIVEEFSMSHLKNLQLGDVSVAGKNIFWGEFVSTRFNIKRVYVFQNFGITNDFTGKSKLDRTFNFQKANIDGCKVGIGYYEKKTVEYGADMKQGMYFLFKDLEGHMQIKQLHS